MFLTMLKGKLHNATITSTEIKYQGSVAIDVDFLEAAGILPNEQIDIYNITNGERFTSYAIAAAQGSQVVSVKGAAARKVQAGDKVIICAYAMLDEKETKSFQPKIIVLGDENKVETNE